MIPQRLRHLCVVPLSELLVLTQQLEGSDKAHEYGNSSQRVEGGFAGTQGVFLNAHVLPFFQRHVIGSWGLKQPPGQAPTQAAASPSRVWGAGAGTEDHLDATPDCSTYLRWLLIAQKSLKINFWEQIQHLYGAPGTNCFSIRVAALLHRDICLQQDAQSK